MYDIGYDREVFEVDGMRFLDQHNIAVKLDDGVIMGWDLTITREPVNEGIIRECEPHIAKDIENILGIKDITRYEVELLIEEEDENE